MSFAVAAFPMLTILFPVVAGLMACLLFAITVGMPFYTASVLTGIVIAAVLIVARYSVPAGALAAVLAAGPCGPNCRCDSVHQPAQQRDFVAVRGRRLLLGFENHRELGHGWVVDQSREERDAELALADIGVTVLVRAEAEL